MSEPSGWTSSCGKRTTRPHRERLAAATCRAGRAPTPAQQLLPGRKIACSPPPTTTTSFLRRRRFCKLKKKDKQYTCSKIHHSNAETSQGGRPRTCSLTACYPGLRAPRTPGQHGKREARSALRRLRTFEASSSRILHYSRAGTSRSF